MFAAPVSILQVKRTQVQSRPKRSPEQLRNPS